MPLDNPEQNDQTQTLDWNSAPDQFRAAHERNTSALEEQRAQNATLLRDNAAMKAGIDISTPFGEFFINGYRGDLTPDAMKTAYEALGVGPANQSVEPPPSAPANDGPTAAELEEQRNRNTLQSGSQPPGSEPPGDLWDTTHKTFLDATKAGQRRENAFAQAIDGVFAAAMDPNHPQHQQAVWNRDRWLQGQ